MEVNTLFASQDYVNLDKYLEEGFVGSFDKVLNHSAEMFNSLFISDRVPEGREVLDRMFDRALQLPNVNDKQKYVDMLEHNFVAFIASTVSNNNGEAIHQDAVRLMQGTGNVTSLPRRIQTLQKQLKAEGKNSLILDELFPILELGSNRSENFGVENLVRFTKRLATYDRNRLIEDFEVLMDNDPQLADDIIKFNILQSGFMTSPVSFASLLPAKHVARVLEPILENYIDRGGILNLNEFEKQFAQNNYMNPVAVERRRMYYNLNPQGMEPTRFERDHMLVKVRDGQRPVAERQLSAIKPPEFIVVTGIPSRHRKEGAYTAQEKLALQEQGKPTTLTRIFQLEPGTVARWEQNQEAMSTQEGRKELRKRGISTKARYFEITRKGNGRYMSEYNAAGDISIIGENNMLLSGVNLTKEHGNIRIQNRLDIREGGPIQEGNILELPGVPIIPVAAAGNASSLDLARKAGPTTGKGIISPDVMKVPFTANENAVTAIIKEDFSGPVNDAMFVAAIANIESVAIKNPDTTFLLPPIGLGINDGNTSDQITSKVNLLAALANNIPNLVMILDPNPTLVEKEHVENLNNMFKCK